MQVLAPISVGELLDKITILQIKQQRISAAAKLININRELAELLAILDNIAVPDLNNLTDQLRTVNGELWHIEDYKRTCEQSQDFGNDFVNAARQVYLKNDLRAQIKRDINTVCGSLIVEEKSYDENRKAN